jgi:hypothetical protein
MSYCCEHCNKEFKSTYVLKNHMKTAKYCLEIQGLILNNNYKCNCCNKNYTQKKDLDRHLSNCIKKIILEKDKIITEKDARIKELQDQLIDIIKTRPPTTINNNNQRINNIVNNLQPITDAHLVEQSQYLTLDHINNGVEGYVKYALEYPFKDRIVCVDYSRKKIKYKDQDENIVDDPEMVKLSHKFFKAIEGKNTEIINNQLEILYEQLNELQNNPNNEMNEDETVIFQNSSEKLTNKIFAFRDNRIEIMDASKGKKSEICNDFIKNICSKVMK